MARFDLQDLKKQASFFLREKLNDARLALTDVSRMQISTEEATNEDPWGPETRTMAMLADAAFELEEYERIVEVIHQRLEGGKKRPWRQLYKTLIVLEYLLTHGPKSMEREFRTDVFWIAELCHFNLTDQQGIDRGLMVRKKADRVLELLNNPDFRTRERTQARKISVGIQGFGSGLHQVHPQDGICNTEQQYDSKDHKDLTASLDELNEQSSNAGAQILQLEPTGLQHEKCSSMPFQQKQDVGLPVSEENSSAASKVKCSTRSYKKSLSSSGYFRERMLRWQPAHDDITKSDEANMGFLDAAKGNHCSSCEYVEGALDSDMCTDRDGRLSTAPPEDNHSLFEGIATLSLEDIYKSASSFPALPRLAIPNFRMKFQQQWQPARLIDCNMKFGKAA